MISARSGRAEVTDILLTGENIDLDIQENVRLQTTSLIIGQHNINIHVPYPQNTGQSALFFSAERGDVTITKSLLKAGANAHLKDRVSYILYILTSTQPLSLPLSLFPLSLSLPPSLSPSLDWSDCTGYSY